MGFRTVVMLSNDYSQQWQDDPELGKKIFSAANNSVRQNLGYGYVVECVHADTQTLAVLDAYDGFKAIAHSGWCRGQSDEEIALKLLKEAADKLGYRLAKKPTKKK